MNIFQIIKKLLLLFLIIIQITKINGQGINNNGASLIIEEGAFIHGGSLEMTGSEPKIHLNGTLDLEGDWENNSLTAEVFTNIEETPNGILLLSGENITEIGGSIETYFENLTIINAEKILNINNSEIFGNLEINGILNLNTNKLILKNTNSDINYISGYILSETNPNEGYGEIEIFIGQEERNFNIPFGTGNSSNDLNIGLTVLNSSNSETGSIIFATYPTNTENEPFPLSVEEFNGFSSLKAVDRFWKIEPNFYVKPDFSLELTYIDSEVQNNELIENDLKLIRYNPELNIWNDNVFSLEINENNNTAGIENINGLDFFTYWSLADVQNFQFELEIPNGITPNFDGYNDTWIINNLPENTQIIIYNRWGDKVYESNNYQNNWAGDNQPSGAYYYILNLPDGQTYSGDVNILK